jgi:hypothetical protein
VVVLVAGGIWIVVEVGLRSKVDVQ